MLWGLVYVFSSIVMSLPGLQSYHADSEISDSEGETSPVHDPPPAPGVVSSGLGIPQSHPPQPSPPTFVRPVVHSAPSIGLVDYQGDEDDFDTQVEGPHTESIVTLVNVPNTKSKVQTPQNTHVEEETESVKENTPERSPSPDIHDEPLFLPLDNIHLPPEPLGTCSQALQDKIIELLKKKERLGVTPYDVIKNSKSFRNPSIYDKLVQLCDIDEFGTNYHQNFFDPNEWTSEDYYEKLADAQKKAHEMKQRARAERSKIEFKTGTKLPGTVTATKHTLSTQVGSSGSGLLPTPVVPAISQDIQKKRQSKWDLPSGQPSGRSRGSSPKESNTGVVGAQALVNARLIDKSLMNLFKS